MPRTPKPADPFLKLPKLVRGVIETCRAGETLCLHLKTCRADSREPDNRDWFFEPSGKAAPPRSSEKASRTTFLVPSGDGLFEGSDQTWRAAL